MNFNVRLNGTWDKNFLEMIIDNKPPKQCYEWEATYKSPPSFVTVRQIW